VATDDGKTGVINSDGWSQSKSEISGSTPRASAEERVDRQDNDIALTKPVCIHHQNRQEQIHDPIACNAHIVDIAPDVAKENLSPDE